MATSFTENLLPEYDIVHHFDSVASARQELPSLLRGEAVKPQSGVGSNFHASQPCIPKAIVVGAGFSEDEVGELRKIEGANTLPWLYPDTVRSVGSILTGPFLLDSIASRVKSCLQANGIVEDQEAQRHHPNMAIATITKGIASAASAIQEDDERETLEYDQYQLERSVVRKVDWWLLPLLFITYNLNFMDKTILSSAAVFGLKKSTASLYLSFPIHLHGSQYSWASSVFYFGYLFWEYPTSVLIQRLPVGKYVSANTFFWGAFVALTAACNNYGGLITVRFLLGIAEATISPAFLYITSMWYTRSESPTRVGIWFAGNSLGGVITSFLAFGLGHVRQPLEPWQWMFIVLGTLTIMWGLVLLVMLPDSIANARFLNDEEKKIAERRVVRSGTGKVQHAWQSTQVVECLKDPKTILFFVISLLTQIPNGGTQNFGNLVLTGFGFTSLQSTLVTLPASFISIITIMGTGRAAGHWRGITLYLICAVVLCPIAGSAIIYSDRTSQGVKLFGYYLLATGNAALPLSMSLVGVNYKGSTKKMTMTALLFLAYCAGNIAGPQFFKTSEAPHYGTAFRAIMICYALVLVVAMALRVYLVHENRRLDRARDVAMREVAEPTDWSTPEFCYRM
ncbi:allantoate permease [Teratosphaeria destructans]|uniref:Allantoate permease n=1 Tax=Teratosphaeria destructans TaxID=418781 RepID=A0A9W7SY37_9PEZI|nr:allantoate permease [Teratosphaeria destructans]